MRITTSFSSKVGIFVIFLLLFIGLLIGFSDKVQAKASLTENARIITAPASGGGPQVRIIDSSGKEITNFFVYPSSYRGGFNVAVGDVNGDGENEIVVAPTEGFGPNVRIFTAGGNYLAQFNAYDSGFRGGVNIAVGDIDGDSVAEIITAPNSRGGPNVRIFGYRDGKYVPVAPNFMAYDSKFHGGVNIAAGDIDGDGVDEIITAPKSKGGPNVKIFDLIDGEMKVAVSGFMAYDSKFRGGVSVAAGDVNGDGKDEIITGVEKGGGPQVRIYEVKSGENEVSLLSSGFFAFDKNFRGGVNLAAGDVDLDGEQEIIAAVAGQDKPIIRIFKQDGTRVKNDFLAYSNSFKGGVNVASEKIYLRTTNKIIYSQGDGTDNSANAIIKNESSNVYTLQTQFRLLNQDMTDAYTQFHTNYFGVYLRFKDINNWMRVDFYESYRPAGAFWVRLLIRENGSYTTAYTQQVSGISIESLFSSWHTLKVIDNGSILQVYLDGTEIMEKSYSTSIQVGQKGYMANICTRVLWDNMTISSSSKAQGVTNIDIGKTSPDKYGSDMSRNRYASNTRCKLSANPYNELAPNSNYSLPKTWMRGDGLWIQINDDREVVVEEKGATPPAANEMVIYSQGDGTDNSSSAVIKSDNSTNYNLNTKFKLFDSINTDDYTKFHSSYFGVYLRYQDVSNWVRADFFTAYRPAGKLYVRLLINQNGNYNSVKSIPIEGYDPANLFSSWHDLLITDTGSNVSVKLDGVEVLNADYTTSVKAGMKGYLSTIATRSVWEDMTVTKTEETSSGVTTTPNTTSAAKYGLDISSYRYNTDSRYQISQNPYYSYTSDTNYSLPAEWKVGDGLWLYMVAATFL